MRWPARTGVSMIMVPIAGAGWGAAAGAGAAGAAAGVGAGVSVGAGTPLLPSSSDRPRALMASAMSAVAPRTATAFKRYFFSSSTKARQSIGGELVAMALTSMTANSSSKKSETPPVICLSAASMASGSAECIIYEMATTVEILISIGRDWLLGINALRGLAVEPVC